jgi:hypothetical protein
MFVLMRQSGERSEGRCAPPPRSHQRQWRQCHRQEAEDILSLDEAGQRKGDLTPALTTTGLATPLLWLLRQRGTRGAVLENYPSI